MVLTIILIFAWYIFTGIREGLLWSKQDSYLGISDKVYSFLVFLSFVGLNWCLPVVSWSIYLFDMALILYIFTLIGRNFLINNKEEKFLFWKIDYHFLRAIEGGIFFVIAWICLKDFLLLSALWITGNWVYKRIMNKSMYGTFKHKLTMTTYWMFGYPFPYSDRWYDYSLILPALYFIGIIL